MTSFHVDLDTLQHMQSEIATLAQGITDGALEGNLDAATAGSSAVSGAYDTFTSHWSGQRWKLRENLDRLAKAVDGAVQGYHSAETAVTQAATPGATSSAHKGTA